MLIVLFNTVFSYHHSLQGYLPANIDRREETLQRKRQEYLNFVQQYYHMRSDPVHKDTFRQIHIDVPRMNPSIALFHQQLVQEVRKGGRERGEGKREGGREGERGREGGREGERGREGGRTLDGERHVGEIS